jgi:hypothetical protein
MISTGPVQLLLMFAPLAGYLYLLAVWHAGRAPRVLSGALDVTLLGLGLGGLILFGPFGRLLARMLFGRPALVDWLILILAGLLFVSWLARRAARRLVVYHVDADALDAALRDLLGPYGFARTLDGYEERTHRRGVRVECSPRWQSAVLTAYGNDPSGWIRGFAPALRDRLRAAPPRNTAVAVILFGLSALTMLVPLTGYLLAQPRARAALRVLLQHLHGG